MPTTLISRNTEKLNNIPTLLCSWHVQQGMAPLVLCPYNVFPRPCHHTPQYRVRILPMGIKPQITQQSRAQRAPNPKIIVTIFYLHMWIVHNVFQTTCHHTLHKQFLARLQLGPHQVGLDLEWVLVWVQVWFLPDYCRILVDLSGLFHNIMPWFDDFFMKLVRSWVLIS